MNRLSVRLRLPRQPTSTERAARDRHEPRLSRGQRVKARSCLCRDMLEGGEDMTRQGRLAEYKRRYWEAMNASRSRRDFLLSDIMSDMEREFGISMFRDRAEKEVASDVLRFYRLVSDSRLL